MPNAETVDSSVLIYKRDPHPGWRGVTGLWVFTSPVSFLARAMEGGCRHLVVFLEWSGGQEKASLLELCSILRESPLSRDLPLGCIMQERHREMLSGLAQAAVGWVSFAAPDQPLLPVLLTEPGDGGLGWLRLGQVLREICPHLNYLPVADGREMCVCGAYRNRMVLGRDTLHNLCQVNGHSSCTFYVDHHPADPGAGNGA